MKHESSAPVTNPAFQFGVESEEMNDIQFSEIIRAVEADYSHHFPQPQDQNFLQVNPNFSGGPPPQISPLIPANDPMFGSAAVSDPNGLSLSPLQFAAANSPPQQVSHFFGSHQNFEMKNQNFEVKNQNFGGGFADQVNQSFVGSSKPGKSNASPKIGVATKISANYQPNFDSNPSKILLKYEILVKIWKMKII